MADIDARGPGRKKPADSLCPTVDEAVWVVEQFNKSHKPLRASLVIGSGHGCYPVILFREPLVLSEQEDAALLDSLSRRFHQSLHAIASARGWTGTVDFCDAAKVLRLPGCVNYKDRTNPAPVRLIDECDARFNPSDLDELLPAMEMRQLVAYSGADGRSTPRDVALRIDPGAQPPFDKFEALRCNETRFERTWERQRPDLKDQSPSGYDQSLANFAALAEWTDQEIADLIIASRRKQGAGPKRLDYFQRTIALARSAAAPRLLDQKIVELVNADTAEPTAPNGNAADGYAVGAEPNQSGVIAETAAPAPPNTAATATVGTDSAQSGRPGQASANDPHARRRAILEMLSARIRVPITRIVKYTGEPSQYRLETASGNIQLGGVAGLISQSKLRLAIADATGRYLPPFDSEVWPSIAQALLNSCETVDRGEDATLRGKVAEWLRRYLGERSIHLTLAEGDEGREPFVDGESVCIYSADLQRWLQIRENQRVTQQVLTAELRAFGAEPEKKDLEIKGKLTSRSVWKLPPGPWIPECS